MALGAGKGGVTSIKRIPGRTVSRQAECGGLPAVDVVAAGTVTPVGTSGKLAAVDVLLMAVRAAGVRHWIVEISRDMALAACELRVLPQQSELRAGMVELRRSIGRLP
jgi:hypothetical protein